MNKRSLILMIALALLLAAGVLFGLKKLYPRSEGKVRAAEAGQMIERHELIEAVPSDAAIVFCVKDFGRAKELLGDSVAVFRELTSRKFDRIMKEPLPGLRRAPAIISIHYSKDMPPLLVVKAPAAASDSVSGDRAKLIAAADSSGLFHKTSGDLVMISSSETIINSSIRHLGEGHSVLEASGFAQIAAQAPGSDVIFASNAYTDNILETYFARKYRKFGTFIKELGGWTAFSIDRHSEGGVSMSGNILYGSDPAYYLNVLRHGGTSSVGITDAVPSSVDFIIDLPIGNLNSYIKAYRNYLDAKTRLDKYENTLSKQKKGSGKSAEDWARSLDIMEVAVANVHVREKLRQILLIKPGKKQADEGLSDFSPFAGFAKTLFGDIFTGEDESSCTGLKGWIVIGAQDCVEEYSGSIDETLRERLEGNGLGDRIPQKGCGLWIYHSMTEDPNLIGTTFSPLMAEGFRNVVKGVNYVPVTLAASAKGDKMGLELALARTNITRSKAPTTISTARDTAIAVPKGPYVVRNSATGKDNTLYQNSHLSICLRDENGKDLWGIPFKFPILGHVEEIDFFGNGKLQYLFAADSKLYLLDRLGRFVGGFPVDLGKKIAVGPQVFDLPGEGTVAMVLHKDNTVGLYDLKGQAAGSWKGITASETIKGLPEPLKGGGKDYWVVRTSAQAMVFPFEGGEPLVKGEGKKMIRPDSNITVNDKGVFSAKCYDGKERTFKPNKEKR